MTKTVTKVDGGRAVLGGMVMTVHDVDITSYTASGEPLTAANLGLVALIDVIPISKEKFVSAWYDYANSKLRVFGDTTIATESTATTDCGVIRVTAFGY